MLAVDAVGGDAASTPPSARLWVRKVPGSRWFGWVVELLLPIRMFAGAAGAEVLVAGACTVNAEGEGSGSMRCCWNCCPGDCRLPLSYEPPLLWSQLSERPLLPR